MRRCVSCWHFDNLKRQCIYVKEEPRDISPLEPACILHKPVEEN